MPTVTLEIIRELGLSDVIFEAYFEVIRLARDLPRPFKLELSDANGKVMERMNCKLGDDGLLQPLGNGPHAGPGWQYQLSWWPYCAAIPFTWSLTASDESLVLVTVDEPPDKYECGHYAVTVQ